MDWSKRPVVIHTSSVVEFQTKSKHYQEALFTANWVREQEEATTRHSRPSAWLSTITATTICRSLWYNINLCEGSLWRKSFVDLPALCRFMHVFHSFAACETRLYVKLGSHKCVIKQLGPFDSRIQQLNAHRTLVNKYAVCEMFYTCGTRCW